MAARILLLLLLAAAAAAAIIATAAALKIGVNIDPTNPAGNPKPADMTALGAQMVRIEYKDGAGAGSKPSAFGTYDPVVKDMLSAGVEVLMILDYSSLPGRPDAGAANATWDQYISQFAKRAGDVAGHYKGQIKAYEIWNEEDLTSVGNVPANVYGVLLEAAYRAIKSADSGVRVIMGGLASGDPNYVIAAAAATGGHLYADSVGVHPYGQRPTADWPSSTWGFGVLCDLLSRYAQASGKSIWVTEYGTNDMNAQPDFPNHAFTELNTDAACHTDVALWFCWSDGMVAPFGLVDTSFNRKPSYFSYQSYARANL